MKMSPWMISLLLDLLVLIQCSDAVNFVESPSNITLPVGSVAEFRCQHQSLDAIISWLVNGSLSTQFPNVTRMDSGSVSTLTIPSVLEYNGIEVVCQAFIGDDGSPVFEQTPPAIILIPVIMGNFLTVPSPPVLIVTMEERHVYMCNHSETISVFWRVNGSRLNVEIFPIEIDPSTLELPGGGRVYTLEIGGRLEHNATSIQCSARLSDGYNIVMTPSVSFFMQGPLQSVVNLKRMNDTIVWGVPFSLNLTNVEPDIVYCVEVYNITCGGRKLLISDCDVMETIYTSETLQSGYIYEYTVTPRSNVDGAQNGTTKNLTEQFRNLQLSTKSHTFSFIGSTENETEDNPDIQYLKLLLHLNLESQEQEQPVNIVDAPSYSLSLDQLDDQGNESDSFLISTIAVRNGSSVIFKTSLPYRRLWNYTVLAYDCEEHPLLETNELSTHDIQNISVTSPQPGEVRVTGDFIDGSTATGLLTIVISTSEIFYHLIERRSDQLRIKSSVQGVVGGEHSISFFVVEESGLPFSRTALIPKVVSVENSNNISRDVVTPPSSSIEYSLQSTSTGTGVCITCTFLDSSATDCVAVVHQRISQLSSSGLMNIESSHKLTRSSDTASGCIEGVNMEDYQVGVVGGREVLVVIGSASPSSTYIVVIATVLGVLLPIGVLLVIVITILCLKGRHNDRVLQSPHLSGNVIQGLYGERKGILLFRVGSGGPTARHTDDSAHAHNTTPTSPGDPKKGAKSSTASSPTEKDEVYHELQGSQNAKGLLYVLISDLPIRTRMVSDDLHKTCELYIEIKHQGPSSCPTDKDTAELNPLKKTPSTTTVCESDFGYQVVQSLDGRYRVIMDDAQLESRTDSKEMVSLNSKVSVMDHPVDYDKICYQSTFHESSPVDNDNICYQSTFHEPSLLQQWTLQQPLTFTSSDKQDTQHSRATSEPLMEKL